MEVILENEREFLWSIKLGEFFTNFGITGSSFKRKPPLP